MGGQGALQLAYRYPREFPVVAAISPAIDFHHWYGQGLPLDEMFASREAARQATATLQIHPLGWPRHQLLVCDPEDVDWYEGVDRLVAEIDRAVTIIEDLRHENAELKQQRQALLSDVSRLEEDLVALGNDRDRLQGIYDNNVSLIDNKAEIQNKIEAMLQRLDSLNHEKNA